MTKFLRRREVEDLVGLRKSTIHKRMAQGNFPKGIRIGGARRWPLDEIERWMDEQRATDDQPGLPPAA